MIMIKNNESDGSVTITTSMPNVEYLGSGKYF